MVNTLSIIKGKADPPFINDLKISYSDSRVKEKSYELKTLLQMNIHIVILKCFLLFEYI